MSKEHICQLCSASKNQPEGTTPIELIDGMCRWCSNAWNLGYNAALDGEQLGKPIAYVSPLGITFLTDVELGEECTECEDD
jgi:hypothetical protein